MTRTFILLCTGVFAIAYALYELNHYGVYYPDASNPQLFTGWKAVTELGPAILATGIAATAFSLWLFILFFRSSESRRIQREISGYQQALREAEEAHTARQNALIRDHNMKTETLHSHYCDAANVLREEYAKREKRWRQALQNAREEARQELEEQTEALNQRASGLLVQEQTLKARMEEVRKYVAGERHNTELARLEAEKAEERRRNACATAERRRRKLEKLQATGGTAGQKH